MAETAYTYYVEPLRNIAHCNEVIAKGLGEAPDGTENLCRDVLCADGKTHDLWRCSQGKARDFWVSKNSLQINIKIWRKKGNGQIEEAPLFLFNRKRQLPKNLRKQISRAQRKATTQ